MIKRFLFYLESFFVYGTDFFGHLGKQLDKKAKVDIETFDVTT